MDRLAHQLPHLAPFAGLQHSPAQQAASAYMNFLIALTLKLCWPRTTSAVVGV
jgi:hypothetical protein